MAVKIITGDCRAVLAAMPENQFHACITSPPYFGLRDYGIDSQIGLEKTPQEYVAELVSVFREVRRVLRDDGTLWLNLGDSYARSGNSKPKDLIGIPWRVAFALQADGWYLRQDIIWHKPNPMPESVQDRCTKAHEYMFLLSKSERYFWDTEAMKEPCEQPERVRSDRFGGKKYQEGVKHSDGSVFTGSELRNRRSVWSVATQPFSGAHFATFPPALIEPCVRAAAPVKIGHVLDPFGGAGTTGLVCNRLSRQATLIELNPAYAALAQERIDAEAPLLGAL